MCFLSRPIVRTINRARCAVKPSSGSVVFHFLVDIYFSSFLIYPCFDDIDCSPSFAFALAISVTLASSPSRAFSQNPPKSLFAFILPFIELVRRLNTYMIALVEGKHTQTPKKGIGWTAHGEQLGHDHSWSVFLNLRASGGTTSKRLGPEAA